MEETPTSNTSNTQNIDVNNPEFYESVQTEIESDLARMKKTVEVMMNLRLTAAEVEVETAALYHAELWYDLLDIHSISEENSEEEDDSKGENENGNEDENENEDENKDDNN